MAVAVAGGCVSLLVGDFCRASAVVAWANCLARKLSGHYYGQHNHRLFWWWSCGALSAVASALPFFPLFPCCFICILTMRPPPQTPTSPTQPLQPQLMIRALEEGRKGRERERERRCLAPPAASLVKLRLPAASVCLSAYKSTCQIGCTHSLASLRLERSTASVVSTYSFTNSNLRDLLCTFFHFNSCFLIFAILFCSVVCHLWLDLSSLIFVVCSIATSCCCRSSLFRDATQHRLPFHSSFPLRSLFL